MTSTPDRSNAAQSTPSPGRRLFNRITSPFGNKARNIPEFEIRADDPHKQYGPGEILPGNVRLRVTKPTRVTHIVARLHGYVQVFKNPGSPGESYRANPAYLTTHRGSKSGEYFGNGFASLFEDEVVLCGDGRLADGTYQFNFELEFPDRDLPSSIEFERGTICYMITAMMTRPTTMSPVMTCESKVHFLERVDIATLDPPRPLTTILTPVARRLRPKTQARKLVDPSEKRNRISDSCVNGSDAHRNSEASSVPTSSMDTDDPISPSELSSHSGEGSQGLGTQYELQSQMSPTVSDAMGSKANTSKTSLPSKSITARVESQAGGCLRGDNIPIKIDVNHTKQVKSMHGVIVTLYRLARVDMRPSIPLGPTEKGKDAKFEEYYPKSMTGLGGLSLSGAGSSHVFRKDLSQSMAPLFVDPRTLTAEIHTKVRVPEEAFPTISTVPGHMISFRYYVEVVVDIQGRLSGQDRTFSSLPGQAGLFNNNLSMETADMERSAFTPFGSTIVDTASMRRDKGVVASSFEVIIGTKDSERKGKRKMIEAVATPEEQPAEQQQTQGSPIARDQTQQAESGYDWYDTAGYNDPRYYEQFYWYYQQHGQPMPEPPWPGHQQNSYDVPPPLPMPQLEDESQMSEKERIRQAETRLLPSQPPGMEIQRDGGAYASSAPTAPYLPAENRGDLAPPPAWHAGQSSQPPPSPFGPHNGALSSEEQQRTHRLPSVPAYEPPAAGSSAHAAASASDGKQEMHRRQLEASASAPPMNDDEHEGPSAVPDHAPSAPTFDQAEGGDEAIHDSHGDAPGESSLPRYER
ncbi:ph-response sensor protein [Extremus antarcticus]|uniref:Ph-response sensor protein n=1 Tax=Extremus antarcticus TaxID=702011 RepID=A0AAJ0DBZ6_9PEZI|nr:ph-response sensor protein [Extremus antarcticus]